MDQKLNKTEQNKVYITEANDFVCIGSEKNMLQMIQIRHGKAIISTIFFCEHKEAHQWSNKQMPKKRRRFDNVPLNHRKRIGKFLVWMYIFRKKTAFSHPYWGCHKTLKGRKMSNIEQKCTQYLDVSIRRRIHQGDQKAFILCSFFRYPRKVAAW